MKIYLVRHAESMGNISGKFNGVTDLPLSPKGEKQAKLLGQFFNDKKLDKIYTSVLRRTIQTANLSTGRDESTFIKLAELNEINGGHWEGVEWDKIEKKYNKEFVLWNERPHLVRLPGGESLDELYDRSIGVLKRIIEENDPEATIGVFSHGTVLKVWVAFIRNLALEELPLIAWYENSSVTGISCTDGELSLEFYDNHNHLPMEIKTVANTPWGCNMKETCKY